MAASFRGHVVAVTGGASGIGLATAKALARFGAAVSLADVDSQKLSLAASAIKAQTPDALVLTTELDVRDRQGVARWISDTQSKLGAISGCFNSAGVANASHSVRPLDETPDTEVDTVIGINLIGAMNCVKEQVRAMKSTGTKGSIVVVSSAGGLVGMENGSLYSASKFGVIGLVRSVSKEVGRFGIRVTAIAPGFIKTPMTVDHTNTEAIEHVAGLAPLQRAGEPEEIADLAVFLLGNASSFITGSTHLIDGGMLASLS